MSNLILIDWGTSSFRAILLNKELIQIDEISSSNGILNIKNNDFYSFLLNTLNTWIEKYNNKTPIIMSGMIGSKNGWKETAYCFCDTSINELANNLEKIPNINENIYIVPGVKTIKNDFIDLIRGEEVQVFGALEVLKKNDALLVLPGTHSKWVEVKDKKIIDFKTNMTGEVFKVISENTILAKSISNKNINENTFEEALKFTQKEGGLLNQIFQIRANVENIKEENTYSFLSALIINEEIKSMIQVYNDKEIILVGNEKLNNLYKKVFDLYKIKTITINSNEAVIEAMKLIYKKIQR